MGCNRSYGLLIRPRIKGKNILIYPEVAPADNFPYSEYLYRVAYEPKSFNPPGFP